jgi:hypothetical protein
MLNKKRCKEKEREKEDNMETERRKGNDRLLKLLEKVILSLWEGHRLKVFGNREMKRTFDVDFRER